MSRGPLQSSRCACLARESWATSSGSPTQTLAPWGAGNWAWEVLGEAPDGGVPHHLADLPEEEWARVRAVFPAPVQDLYPATGMQAVMISEYAKDTVRAGVYHPQQCHRLTDESLSIDALRHAIEQVVRRHAIFRTVFTRAGDGTLLQVVRESPSIPIVYHDLRGLAPDEQQRAVKAGVGEDLDTPFDPYDPHGSLMRFVIFHREDGMADLLISAHHAIEDGWGNVHFLNTLFEAYAEARDGRPVSAAPVPNTYREFVALEAEIVASDEARTLNLFGTEAWTLHPVLVSSTDPVVRTARGDATGLVRVNLQNRETQVALALADLDTRMRFAALSLPRHKAILTALLARDPLAAHHATLVQLDETREDLGMILQSRLGAAL